MKLKLIIGIVGILSACGFTNAPSLDTNQEKQDNNWVIGPFLRPEGVNPVISPQPTEFYCPMRKQQVKWEKERLKYISRLKGLEMLLGNGVL